MTTNQPPAPPPAPRSCPRKSAAEKRAFEPALAVHAAAAGLKVESQLFFAPSRIQVRIAPRSHVESFFLPCGMRVSGEPRQSSSQTRLLLSGSRACTIGPNLVPF